MKMMRFLCCVLLSVVTVALFPTSTATAQPHGWPCDYGLRPGNAWYYRAVSSNGEIYCNSVLRDSSGEDGTYWVYLYTVPDDKYGHWYRIDSACTLYRYHYQPREMPDETMFRSTADSGAWWTVYTDPYTVVAQVNMVYHSTVFEHSSKIHEVVYYQGEVGRSWFQAAEYASGIGVIRYRWHPFGLDEIIGAVIDGVSYGRVNPSGIDDDMLRTFPQPASAMPTLSMEVTP